MNNFRPDHWFDNAAQRETLKDATVGGVGIGQTAGDRDTGNIYLRTASGWTQTHSGGAALVTDGAIGIARTRWIDVATATLPTIAGSGTVTFSNPVIGCVVDSVMVSAGTLPLTLNNWTVRYAVDAANDEAAGVLLPTTFPSGDPTAEGYQIGSFNVQPMVVPHTIDISRVMQITLPQPIPIDVSDGILRLDFAHNLGAGVTIILGIRTVERLT